MYTKSQLENFFSKQPNCNYNNLQRYIKFIQNASTDESDICQIHHIIPKFLGGSDEEDNLIKLSIKQHIHAHKILYYMLKSKESMYSVLIFNKYKHIDSGLGVKTYINISKEQYSEKQSSLSKRTKWMTNGNKDTRVYQENIDEYLLSGWLFGRSSKSTKNKIFCYDVEEQKNVKIDRETFDSSNRYIQKTRIIVWDKLDQPDFPYIKATAIPKDDFDKEKYGTQSELVLLEDKRYIHREYFDENKHKKFPNKRSSKSNGIYITPVGNFQNVHEAKKHVPLTQDTIIRWCRDNNKEKIKTQYIPKDFVHFDLQRDDLKGKTPNDLGYDFIPLDQCTKLNDGTLVPK